MALLTRDEIKKADDLPWEDVPVPEWGGTVRVRALGGTARERIEEAVSAGRKGKSAPRLRATAAILSCVGEDGKPLFDDSDLGWLSDEKSGAALDRVSTVALRLSKLDAGAVEAEVKNSAAVPS